jgi:hypothetical protein
MNLKIDEKWLLEMAEKENGCCISVGGFMYRGSVYLTYRKLRDFLNQIPEEQLDQAVQIIPPHTDGDAKLGLHGVYGLNTIEYYFGKDQECRSVLDNKHHPEQLVILSDGCPFSEEGDSFYTLQPDGTMIGNATGKVVE